MRNVLCALLLSLVCIGPATAATPSPAPASPTPGESVHIKDFAFHAGSLTIHAGDTVRFVNDDDDAHTVTAADKSFDSGGLDAGEAWVHTFTKPGTYAYICALHPYMKATIVVLPAAPAGK
jgi:plastocyanin